MRRTDAPLPLALDQPRAVATDRAIHAALRFVPEPGPTIALHATNDEFSDAAIGCADQLHESRHPCRHYVKPVA